MGRARPVEGGCKDIVEMRKHILARIRFENTRKMVAADTNRDASVDVADIVAMRRSWPTDYFGEDGDEQGGVLAFCGRRLRPFSRRGLDQVKSFEKIGPEQ